MTSHPTSTFGPANSKNAIYRTNITTFFGPVNGQNAIYRTDINTNIEQVLIYPKGALKNNTVQAS